MNITRIWAMPNAWTFTIKPIKELLNIYVGTPIFRNGLWCDPFAGMYSPAQVTNDLNPHMPTTSHLDAREFLKLQKNKTYDGVLYDPPYSFRQASEEYQKYGCEHLKDLTQSKYWSECKDEIARIVKPGGKVICCGWNSNGIGIKRNFDLIDILLVAHGGNKNDTIVTVEQKKGGE